jgi:hypothetical protein
LRTCNFIGIIESGTTIQEKSWWVGGEFEEVGIGIGYALSLFANPPYNHII